MGADLPSATWDFIDSTYQAGRVAGPNGAERDIFPASLPLEDGRGLNRIVREIKPKRSLEIGMALGLSTLFIFDALPDDAHHTAIDPFQTTWFDDFGPHLVNQAGYADRFRIVREPSYLVLPRLAEANEQFEFVFIDGNHRFDYTLVDFFLVDKILAVGGTVVFHDMWMPSVRKVVSFIRQNRIDAFHPDPRFMPPTNSFPNAIREACRLTWRMRDIGIARSLAHYRFYNFCALLKTKHIDDVQSGLEWDAYRPF